MASHSRIFYMYIYMYIYIYISVYVYVYVHVFGHGNEYVPVYGHMERNHSTCFM